MNNAPKIVVRMACRSAEARQGARRSIRKLAFESYSARGSLIGKRLQRSSIVQSSVRSEEAATGTADSSTQAATGHPWVLDFSKQADIRAWNKQMGHENVDAEPIGVTTGYLRPETMR